ncbi:hypothetical protein O181_111256 [Austropuccinia psidii MF-1]|uniref:Uncharacterized protein n=1 Tax=Austropuccinia psidii MF-1 TaxID=1389203 RepID=A0A9Q3K0R3_9BASI|nr:hypothetical protein [Austropuccinia psidii MF-1]
MLNTIFFASNNAIRCISHTIHLAACDGLDSHSQSGPLQVDQEAGGNTLGPMTMNNLVDEPEGQNTQYDSIINFLSKAASYIWQILQRSEKFICTINLIYEEGQTTKATTLS